MRSKNPIIPACLVLSRQSFLERLEFSKSVGNSIHIDVIDNDFVPGHTLPINDWPPLKIEYAEAHLMVGQPLGYLESLKARGLTRAIVHIEANFSLDELVSWGRQLDLLLGWAINLNTDLNEMKRFLTVSSYVQVMGVVPGRTGQPQQPQTASAVSYFNKLPFRRLIVSVDGGVNENNIAHLKEAGADYLVASSSLYDKGSWEANFNRLMATLG